MFDFTTVKEVRLSKGSHKRPEDGMCFMEMAAWFAGEKHSDKPACVSPALGMLGIALNDRMGPEPRDRLLKPMIPHVVGTADDAAETERAEYICMRVFTYGFGIAFPGFARRHGPAKNMRNARDMLHYVYREDYERGHRGRYGDYDHATMAFKYGLTGRYDNDRDRVREETAMRLERMLQMTVPMEPYIEAVPEIQSKAVEYPNIENVRHAAGLLADLYLVIPDWSVGMDILREAIRLGRHDGFKLTANLEKRHQELRELVDA